MEVGKAPGKDWKISNFFWEKCGKPHTIFHTNPE